MATKLSNLPAKTTLDSDDLFYVVKDLVSGKMTRDDVRDNLLLSVGDNQHISGVIEWVSGLTFRSVNLVWRFDNVLYVSNNETNTLSAADATNPRIDTFYADYTGVWGVIEGTPAGSPTKPTVDSNTQVDVSFATISALATEPSDYEDITFYNEFGTTGGGESDVTVTGNGTLNSTEEASSGTKSIKYLTATRSDKTDFVWASTKDGTNLVVVKFKIYLVTSLNESFELRLKNGSTEVALKILIADGSYGFDRSVQNSWQSIEIPASDFRFSLTNIYDTIELKNRKVGATYFIDEVIIQEGNGGTPPASGIYVSLTDDETVGGAKTWSDVQTFEQDVEFGNNDLNAVGTVFANDYRINSLETAPATPTSTGVLGDIRFTENYIYLCTATNVWKRAPLSSLGTASPLTTKGDLYGFSTVDDRLPVGADGYVLSADSAEATGLSWIAAGVGDMILASIQIVTGLKTFDALKLGMRNVADTFTSLFTNVNTAARTYTLQDKTGTIAMLDDTDIMGFAASDETTDLAVADDVLTIQMPNYATTLTHVSASVNTAPTGSGITLDIEEGGATILGTLLTLDATEKTSETAATPVVISDSAIAANAILSFNIDVVGSTIAGNGLKFWLYFNRA